jgi:hypothetical protein
VSHHIFEISFPENIGMVSQIPFPEIRTGPDLIYGYIHVCDVSANELEPPIPRFFWDYKDFDLEKTRRSLINFDFSPIFRLPNLEDLVQHLNSIIISVSQGSVPLILAYNIWDMNIYNICSSRCKATPISQLPRPRAPCQIIVA